MTEFTITVTQPTCNCDLLRWVLPTKATQTVNLVLTSGSSTNINLVTATVDGASKGASADTAVMRKCHTDGTVCPETSTYTITDKITGLMPSFITQSTTTNTISVKATAASNIGTYTLRVIQATASGTDQVFDALDLTIHCILASVTAPTAPLLADRTYTIYSPTLTIDMSSVGYATHTQSPDCGYVLTPTYSWTLPTGTTPITTTGAVLKVFSTTQSQASTGYSVTFKVVF